MNTINHKRNMELREEIRIRELRVRRLEKELDDTIPDSGEFDRLAKEIATEEKSIMYYNILLNDPSATEEIARLRAFGEERR